MVALCSKLSATFAFCYTQGIARRLWAMGMTGYGVGFTVTLHSEMLSAAPPRPQAPDARVAAHGGRAAAEARVAAP